MDLRDLSKIDIKDLQKIDLARVQEGIQSRPDILINVLLIGISLFVIIFLYGQSSHQRSQLNHKIVEYKEKLDVLKEQQQYTKEIKEFIKNFRKPIASEQIINQMTDLALRHNIRVSSFSPAEENKEIYWTITTIIFNISANSYADMVSFIKDMENSPYAIKIVRWSGFSPERPDPADSKKLVSSFDAAITVEATQLKNE